MSCSAGVVVPAVGVEQAAVPEVIELGTADLDDHDGLASLRHLVEHDPRLPPRVALHPPRDGDHQQDDQGDPDDDPHHVVDHEPDRLHHAAGPLEEVVDERTESSGGEERDLVAVHVSPQLLRGLVVLLRPAHPRVAEEGEHAHHQDEDEPRSDRVGQTERDHEQHAEGHDRSPDERVDDQSDQSDQHQEELHTGENVADVLNHVRRAFEDCRDGQAEDSTRHIGEVVGDQVEPPVHIELDLLHLLPERELPPTVHEEVVPDLGDPEADEADHQPVGGASREADHCSDGNREEVPQLLKKQQDVEQDLPHLGPETLDAEQSSLRFCDWRQRRFDGCLFGSIEQMPVSRVLYLALILPFLNLYFSIIK
ncbi:hypothetical protein SAMN05444392_12410 [Seinonella peptonophila]|uniref:Uncharacterized protein n=1 Tax=Seinonella peptonophila TaxID=112248 RepID=A0A1M5BHY6_9BACL|nr:hypothetical protein SAMN05444392_12410 [Seinonella peptonophila]